jgi:hypothetical protein
MMYSDDFQDDDGNSTEFDPTPWGSRQRVMPRRAFKAAVSVVAPLPPAPLPPISPSVVFEQAPSWYVTPIVREADVPTWRVPKLLPPPNAPRFDMRRLRLWLPIAGLVTVLVLAFVGTRSNATHISAALTTSAPAPAITMATIEAPAPVAVAPVALASAEPVAPPIAKQIAVVVAKPVVVAKQVTLVATVEHVPVAKRLALAAPVVRQSARTSTRMSSSKRPRLDMDVATPLGDLAKPHRH